MSTVDRAKISGGADKKFGATAKNIIFEDEQNLEVKYKDLYDLLPEKEKLKFESNDFNISYGNCVWNHNGHTYYSMGNTQYEFNSETKTWGIKTWVGMVNFNGVNIWEDVIGKIYFSEGSRQYVLSDDEMTWNAVTWTGLDAGDTIEGQYIWKQYSGPSNIFTIINSNNNKHYLYTGNNEWENISSDFENFNFTGDNVFYITLSTPSGIITITRSFYSYNNGLYVSGKNGVWNKIPVSDSSITFNGKNIWHNSAKETFLSESEKQYKILIHKGSYIFVPIEWENNNKPEEGSNIWTDGTNIYYSSTTSNGEIKTEVEKHIGTAAGKDIPTSGDATNTQVVMGNDSRLHELYIETSDPYEDIGNNGALYFALPEE